MYREEQDCIRIICVETDDVLGGGTQEPYFAAVKAIRQKFKFGNQGTLERSKRWLLPAEMYGYMGRLKVQEVPGRCPLLISEDSMHEMDVSLHHGRRTVDVGKLGVEGKTLTYNKNKHPVVGLMPTTINEEVPASFVAFADSDVAAQRRNSAHVEETRCSGPARANHPFG